MVLESFFTFFAFLISILGSRYPTLITTEYNKNVAPHPKFFFFLFLFESKVLGCEKGWKGQRENLFLSLRLGMLSICGFPDCGKQIRTAVFDSLVCMCAL